MPTPEKVERVAELTELIQQAEIAISTGYQGVAMGDQVELRAKLREAGAEMHVVKNTLLRIAANDAELSQFGELAQGPTALVIGRDEPVGAARALVEFLKANSELPIDIRNAVVDGNLVDEGYVRDLATVPPKDVLLSRLMAGLTGQLTQLIMLLNATTTDFIGLVEARAVQLEAEA